MKVKFLREFGGRETQERHYPPGYELDIEDEDTALDMIERGIVESLEPLPEAVVEAAPKPKRKRK